MRSVVAHRATATKPLAIEVNRRYLDLFVAIYTGRVTLREKSGARRKTRPSPALPLLLSDAGRHREGAGNFSCDLERSRAVGGRRGGAARSALVLSKRTLAMLGSGRAGVATCGK